MLREKQQVPGSSPARVRVRVNPKVMESSRGYLCRVCGNFCYESPTWLTHLALLPRADDLESSEMADQLAFVLRLHPDEWRSMAYLKVKGSQPFSRRQFFEQLIAADRLNYGVPRVCSACLKEEAIWWGIWDLGIVAACPGHRCELVSTCAGCDKALRWNRPAVEVCRCGYDLRTLEVPEADSCTVAISALIYRCAGFPIGLGSFDLGSARFPRELDAFGLDDLIGLILAMASLKKVGKPRKPALNDLATSISVSRDASLLLTNWPKQFHASLQKLIPTDGTNFSLITLQSVFGSFYRYLLDVGTQPQFVFLTEAFEQFLLTRWPGILRGQNRAFSPTIRRETRWVSAQEAARRARLTASQMTKFVRQGDLLGIFVRPARGRGRIECWIDRISLTDWVTQRDDELTGFVSQGEARQMLGLTPQTLTRIVSSGLVRRVKGPERGFPPGVHFSRHDIELILTAFSIPEAGILESNHPDQILFLDAMRLYLGRERLPELIRSVISRDVVPISRDESIDGILGFRFHLKDVRRFCPAKPQKTIPPGYLTYSMAASRLETNTEVIRNLVEQGQLGVVQPNSSRSKLVLSQDVENFAASFVPVKSIANCFNASSRAVAKRLQEEGIEVLIVPLPGKGNKLFARKRIRWDRELTKLARK